MVNQDNSAEAIIEIAGNRQVSVQEALDIAVEHHGDGQLEQADAIYLKVLTTEPEHPVALNLSGVVALQQGQVQMAMEKIRKALKAVPDYAEAHGNLGLALTEAGDLEQAELSHRRALEIEPRSADGLYNLGNILFKLGHHDEAAISYRQALKLEPRSADIQLSLANTLQAAGQLDEAIGLCRDLVESNPRNFQAVCKLGELLAKAGKFDEAAANFQRALRLQPDNTDAITGLGYALTSLGNAAQLTREGQRALKIDGDQPICNFMLSKSLARLVPRWHIPMMNDAPRNRAFESALSRAVSTQAHVLEIGTGSGLLAMMAARVGARHVTTSEAIPLIAETARGIVDDNGYGGKISVIAKRSNELTIGEDMASKADVLVSEILSSEFISEGVLPSIEDAKRRLLTPDARIIPAGGSMMIAVFGGELVGQNIHAQDVCGFDLSRFNSIVGQKFSIHRNDLEIDFLTGDVAAFEFDFVANDHFPPEHKTLRILITKTGTCHGIIQWNRVQMDTETTFENHPDKSNPASAWNHAVYALAQPVTVEAGQTAVVSAMHDRKIPWFTLERIETGSNDIVV